MNNEKINAVSYDEDVKKCGCGVPLSIHNSSCGWENASPHIFPWETTIPASMTAHEIQLRYILRNEKEEVVKLNLGQTQSIQPKSNFLDVLDENMQAQIAGYYNDDKTDEERKVRNAVIEEYKDLMIIYKAFLKGQAVTPQCICFNCNKPYYHDLTVPDELWAVISPRKMDGWKSGGLLCPECIIQKTIKFYTVILSKYLIDEDIPKIKF